MLMMTRGSALLLAMLSIFSGMARGDDSGGENLGLKVPPGFRVRLFADETLANDTYAMTLDALGRVVVTTRGSVSTLIDADGDGRADHSTLFTATETGGMGLAFVGNDLFFCGDGWLSRYRDANGDGRADGPAEHLLPLAFGEHGGHAIREGPDGWLYIIGGNDAGIGPRHATLASSPVLRPEAGALICLNPEDKRSEIIAQGFRNPYDFDFRSDGEIITYDSDVERDVFLPWYTPTRLFHVAKGGHHGWRLKGYLRSWPRPADDPGTVAVLADMGRGSPTGVVSYRHRQFPMRYRDGFFVLDWTFGKVYFVALQPKGSTYQASVEVFLEPTGVSGFAPTDAAVAPDGSLLISIGGRKTRGAVYRVEFNGQEKVEIEPKTTDLVRVLNAPQPLDAWSRAIWQPIAETIGREPFLKAIRDVQGPDADRIRAIEVVTERFGGLDQATVTSLASDASDLVKRRAVWSAGRTGGTLDVRGLIQTENPEVLVAALDAQISPDALSPNLRARTFHHPDRRVRQSSARLAARTPGFDATANGSPQDALTALLAFILAHPDQPIQEAVARRLCDLISRAKEPDLQLQAVMLLQRALGDYRRDQPEIEVITGYALQPSMAGHETLVRQVLETIRPLFPSGSSRLDDELARLLAMLEDNDSSVPGRVSAFWTDSSSATRDLHFLIVLARLRGRRSAEVTNRTARAIVRLDAKLGGQEQRTKQSWNARLSETMTLLLGRDPALGEALLREPGFVAPSHVALALSLAPAAREEAATRFLKAVQSDADFQWSGPLVDLLGSLPPAVNKPLFRQHWDNFALRDALLPRLANPADPADRSIYLDALDSSQSETVRAAFQALESLPGADAPESLAAFLKLLRKLILEPREGPLRTRLAARIAQSLAINANFQESATDLATLRRLYQPLVDRFTHDHPDLAGRLNTGAVDWKDFSKRLARIDWSRGEQSRGEILFRDRGCQTCHSGPRSLGPDLTGVTNRFSRDDLFTAIVAPSLDVSPQYRVSLVETSSGQIYSGLVAFESADGVLLQTGASTTVRLATPEILSRRVVSRSLMPDGLLQGLNDRDLADLDRYLRGLSVPRRER